MTSKAQKTTMNMALKVAIVESKLSSRVVALRARLGEVLLSQIVHGHRKATPKQQERLAKVLQCEVADIFAVDAIATVDDRPDASVTA